MKKNKILINTNNGSYSILIGTGLINNLKKILTSYSIKSSKYLIVFDKNIPKKYIRTIKKNIKKKTIFLKFSSNEKNKNQKSVNSILNILLKNNFNRNDCVIAVGGGIIGDVSAFASSIFKRGIKFVNLPTTLLAQVDSSIGGKTGINTKFGKNLIGSFYQPSLVISDINFLNSLPEREIICGYGEILKHSIIANKKFFVFLSKNISKIIKLKKAYIQKSIYKSCLIKKKIIEKDEKEKNLRKLLNFGHTFAHAYEATLSYSKKLNHGEAVILGIISACKFSFKKKLLNKREYKLIKNHIIKLDKSLKLNKFFNKKDANKIVKFMITDKKNINEKINLVLLKKIGKTEFKNFYKVTDILKFTKNQFTNNSIE
jgi:3-dehydroquinate synthase/shikimate kinase/3-dehydroquinate synthase